jgi:hypothetical protein
MVIFYMPRESAALKILAAWSNAVLYALGSPHPDPTWKLTPITLRPNSLAISKR